MKKRIAAIVIGAGLLLSGFSGCFSTPVLAAEEPMLVKTALQYDIDYSTGKWKKVMKTTYGYNDKGYPSSINTYDYAIKDSVKKTLTYTFNKNLPATMTEKTVGNELERTVTYNKYGQVDKSVSRIPSANSSDTSVYVYGTKNYFSSVFHESIYLSGIGKDQKYNFREESDTVSVSVRNGLLKKTVNRGIYANWNDPEKKDWLRFNGTYTVNYDTNGIAQITSAVFRTGTQSGNQLKFKVARTNGLVTKVVRYRWNVDSGKWEADQKTVFTYTDIPVSNVRYACMINAHIMGIHSNYYIFNWY